MSQSKQKVVKVHSSKSSNEKLTSDFQGTKQKLKTPKRANNRPARKPSPQGNRKHGNTVNEVVNDAEDAASKAEVARMNLKTLQNIDGGISKILCTVAHVELYQYKGEDNMWERTTYEGTLFVYLRELYPKASRGFMILNRLNSENTQEAITHGMEFREQSPFLLYKRDNSSDIFGLCIKDEQDFSQAGKLLNRLSGESTSPAPYDVSSSISPSPNTTGDSQSPVSRSEGPPASSEESAQGGIQSGGDMDLQEVPNHAYLGGQCFSDDTEGSIEGVDSSSPPGASDKEKLPCRQFGVNSGEKNDTNRSSRPMSSFPQQIPMATLPESGPASSVADRNSTSLRGNLSRTPDFKLASNRNVTSPSSSHSKPAMMQHATSLDDGRVYGFNQHGQSPILGHMTNGFSSSMNESSLHSMQRRDISRPANSAAVNINSGNNPHALRAQDESIVRKLFSTSVPSATSESAPADGISPAVLTLFSHANNRQDTASLLNHTHSSMPAGYLSSSLGSSPHTPAAPSQRLLRSSALSLDEVEKQMNEEGRDVPQANKMSGRREDGGVSHQVRSVATNVYGSNIGMIPSSAMSAAYNQPTSHQAPTHPVASHSIQSHQTASSHFPLSTHPVSSQHPLPTHPVSSQHPLPTHQVSSQYPLPTHPVSSQHPPLTHQASSQHPPPTHQASSQHPPSTHQMPSHPAQPREDSRLIQPSAFSISSAAAAVTSSSIASSHPLLLPSSISSVSSIRVDPPTPVAIPSKDSSESGGFPPIPPLMHSPGMMAPPMSRSSGSKSSVKKGGRDGGSVPKRSASADSDSSSCVWSHLSPPSPPEEMTPSKQQPSAAPKRSMTTPSNTTLMSPQQFLECRASGLTAASDREHSTLDPVTKDQFQKTLMYLLQNDKSFVDKIYETHKFLTQSSQNQL